MHQRTIGALAAMVVASGAMLSAEQWLGWRGGAKAAVSTAPMPAALAAKAADVWAVPVGAGHASPVVDGQRVYVFARSGEEEVAQALDLATGKSLWRTGYVQAYTMNSAATGHGKGPKSTPLLAGGRLFTFGITGVLSALDAASGKVIWRLDAAKDFGGPPDFGTSASPILDNGLLIVHVGGVKGGALRAFDPATGAVKWSWAGKEPADGPGYGTPVAVVAGGVRQIVTGARKKVVGVDAATGTLLWSLPLETPYDQNAVTPVVNGDTVIVSGLDQATYAVRPTRAGSGGWQANKLWETRETAMYMSSPVLVNGTLYGMTHRNSGQFFAQDAGTGKVLWKSPPRQAENASLTVAGGRLWCLTDEGALVVLKADPAAYVQVAKLDVAPSATWASPVLLGSQILIKDVEHLRLVRIG